MMEWLDDDVIYGVACALLLMLLIRELLATVAQYAGVPLSRTLHWLPATVLHVMSSVEPVCENLTGIKETHRDVSTQVKENELQDDLYLTSVSCDAEVNSDDVEVKCNGVIAQEGRCSDSLRRRVDTLNAELIQCRQLVANLRQNEQNLRQRLAEQLVDHFGRNRDGKFENICLDNDSRPTSLIRRYNNIYSEERVELLDVLEQSPQGQGQAQGHPRTEFDMEIDQHPEQLLVSIIVECFESTRRRIEQLVDNLHKQLLHMLIQKHPDHATTTAAAVDDDDGDDGNDGEDAGVKSQLKHFDDAVFSLLRQLAAQRDFSPCVEAVCERLQLDVGYLPIKNSNEFRHYVTTCAQLAWSLTAQRPFYVLEYQLKGSTFDDKRHRRFHASDPSSSIITQVIWPGLIEQSTRFCVSKAVVVT